MLESMHVEVTTSTPDQHYDRGDTGQAVQLSASCVCLEPGLLSGSSESSGVPRLSQTRNPNKHKNEKQTGSCSASSGRGCMSTLCSCSCL